MTSDNSVFSFLCSCYLLDDLNPDGFKCRICLNITETSFSLIIMPMKKNSYPKTIDLKVYDKMSIIPDICRFYNEKKFLSLTFLDDNLNQKRFMLSLANSGLIVPINRIDFYIIPNPSFIPDGSFNCAKVATYSMWCEIIRNRFYSIQKDDYEYVHPMFISHCSWYILKERIAKILLSDEYIVESPTTGKNILRWAIKQIRIQSGKLSSVLQQFDDDNVAKTHGKSIKIIYNDSARHHCKSPLWTDEFEKLATDICKASILCSHSFTQGELDIAEKVILLLLGESGIGKSHSKPLIDPKSPRFNDAALELFNYIVHLGAYVDMPISQAVDDLTQFSLSVYQALFPEAFTFFDSKKWNSFMWFANNTSTIFKTVFPDVWKLWYFIGTAADKHKAFKSFFAAINLFMIQKFAENQTEKFDFVMGYWDDEIRKISLDDLLIITSYINNEFNL